MTKPSILIIDDEEGIRFTFQKFLTKEGYSVFTAGNFQEAESWLKKRSFDLVFADIILGDKSGMDVLRMIKTMNLSCLVIIFTGIPSIDTASEAIRLGAFDYLIKPVNQAKLLSEANMALRHKAVVDEKEKYRSNLEAIFKSVQDGIITVDEELTGIEINNAAENLFGLSRRHFIGKKLNHIQNWRGSKCLEILVETLEKRRPLKAYRVQCQHEKGNERLMTLSTYPLLNGQDQFVGAVMTAKDETYVAHLEEELGEHRQFHNLVGNNKKMREIYYLIEKLADVPTTVLIQGESGTGKELAADAIHHLGNRKDKPFVKVNCSALTESLLESELFGHVKGAFTGAIKDKVGRFQKADGGSILLDEIGDISPRMQLRLLKVLQNKEFERVGESTSSKVDIRILAATNQDLSKKVREGSFREDLYYRLNVVKITLPSLRERREDIPLLLEHFIKKLNKKLGKEIAGVSEEVKRGFMNYSWPGNVRELEHCLEHSFVICSRPVVSFEDLPSDFPGYKDSEDTDGPQRILKALENASWNKAKAARFLGMSRKTLYKKIKGYSIVTPEEQGIRNEFNPEPLKLKTLTRNLHSR